MPRSATPCVLALAAVLCAGAAQAQTRCPAESEFRSVNSKIATQISFRNDSRSDRLLYWLDFDGKRVRYAALRPGQDYAANTFVSHPWVATDGAGNCFAVYFPDTQRRHISLTD